ncbi:PREDICTED: uncharacterized protein LOC108783176 isoform X2 [Cyphomyrmex costatus]|uniref:uncharacterized protein LOC108783176 isoform X2 n=1 Tax=Cyphomyrmex costatus TaxID=456900 RepID=UPI000852211C|nr:PREDICTED: uncharacterized protein LOC108783176 isoform X2 [Cyphomyrmex costatus]
MTGCTAPGCTNSDEKGFIMKIFPRDPVRRAQWTAQVGKKDWTPTDRSFLCEVHFSHDMWENNRADGKRKLKINAVPIIFGSKAKMISYHENVRSALRNDDARPASRNDDARPASRNDDARPASQNDEMGYVHEDDLSVQNEKRNNDCENELQVESTENKKNNSELKNISRTIKNQKLIICEQSRIIKKQIIKLKKYKNCIDNLKAIKLNKKRNDTNMVLLSRLRQIFTDDQIAALKNNRRVRKWSNESIMKALKLRFSCGVTGYEELRHQKFPLPGLRTLRRKVENLKFESGISDDIFNFLKLKLSNWNEIDRKCCLVFDEISISSDEKFDNSSQSNIGAVTLPGHTEPNQLVLP